MKENKNYTACCDKQGCISVKMIEKYGYIIYDKETALQLAQSILSAVDEAWSNDNENKFTMDGKTFIAIESTHSSIYGECDMCYFNVIGRSCFNAKECDPCKRKDGKNIY